MKPSAARVARGACFAFAILGALAAGPPEVARVRAPSADLAKWFPRGTELISLRPDEFEDLVRRAGLGPDAPGGAGRLLRARHRARWEGGYLAGETSLAVRRDPAGPCLLPLGPWGVPVDSPRAEGAELRATDDGRVFLWLAPEGPSEVEFAWRQAPRPHSDGRLFLLDLPRVALARIELDLPDRLIPEGFSPATAAYAGPGRRAWERVGLASPLEVRLGERGDPGASGLERPWVSGPVTINVGPASATWRADWSVAVNGPGRALRIGFSPGLEPIEVGGPDVESTDQARPGGRPEVTVRFRPELRGRTSILVRAAAEVRDDGPWTLPAARPIDGEWLGGPVTVRLDRSRELLSCRLLHGRRLPISSADAAEHVALRLEPAAPGPAAELSFSGEGSGRRAKVRGWVRYTRGGSELLADVTWTFSQGRPGEMELDVPDRWSVDRISSEGDEIPWRREPGDGDSIRVHLTPTAVEPEPSSFSVRLRAHGPPPGDAPGELPWIRPVDAAADAVWVATADGGKVIVPGQHEGAAWLDPSAAGVTGPWSTIEPAELSRAFAWRPTTGRGTVSARVGPPHREAGSSADGTAVIASGRLHEEWRLSVRPGDHPLESLPIGWSTDDAPAVRWRLRRPSSPDVELTPRPVSVAERESLGLPGPGVLLDLPEPASSPFVIEGSFDRPWPGRDAIPLVRLPAGFQPRGRLALRVADDLVARAETHQISSPEGGAPDPGPSGATRPVGDGTTRLAQRFEYRSPEARLAVSATPSLAPAARPIVSARLVSDRGAGGVTSHELSVRFLTAPPRQIEVAFPPGTELTSARQGDRPVEVAAHGRGFTIPIQAGTAGATAEILLRYTERAPGNGTPDRRVRPLLPELPAACATFVWTVLPGPGTVIRDAGPGLIAVDGEVPIGPFDRLGIGRGSWPSSAIRMPGSAVSLDDLKRRLAAALSGRRDLGSTLAALARSGGPVVVDRLGLRTESLGPRSQESWSGDGAPRESGDPARLDLGEISLISRVGIVAVVPRSSSLVAATVGSGRDVDDALRAAVLNGRSPDGRWAVAEAWASTESEGEAPSSAEVTAAARRRDFASDGWPGGDAWVEAVPESAGLADLGIACGLFLGLGLALRLAPAPWRPIALGLLTSAALVPLLLAPGRFADGSRSGIVLGIVSAWLVQSPRRRAGAAEPVDGTSSGRSARSSSRAAIGVALALAAWSIPTRPKELAAQVGGGAAERIVAIFPYEGGPDVVTIPSRVVLRLQDHARLRSAAEANEAARPTLFARRASYELRGRDRGAMRLSSEISLILDGEAPQTWRVPTGGAREIQAWLDDRPRPIRLEDEGRSGVVTVAGRGPHRLRVERTLAVADGAGPPTFRSPINAVPCATMKVDAGPPGEDRPPLASGEPLGGSGIIEVRWAPRDDGAPATPGTIRGLILWDALPAGDLLRLRLAPAGPDILRQVRLVLEEDTRVRVADGRRPLDTRSARATSGVEWAASFDRPGTADDPIELELWRPSVGDPGARQRSPRVGVIGGDFRGVIALRQPGDWAGRLVDPSGAAPMDDESFVESWGALPDDSLTLAGTSGFRGVASAEAAVHPIPPRRSVQATTHLELGEGRVDVAIEAVVNDLAGRSNELDIGLPPSFVPERVEADGLVGYSVPEPGSIHMEFRQAPGPARKVTLRGYLLATPRERPGEASQYEVERPWPRWSDIAEEEGALTIASSTRPTLDAGPEVAAVSAVESPPGPRSPAQFRRSYRVDRGEVRAVRWPAAAPRVGVVVQSRLIVGREASELDATLRYDVAGGPLEALYLRLPVEWAEAAEVHLVGDTFRRTSETRAGWTTWTIRPDHPAWGVAGLRVTSSRPNPIGQAFAFPDLVPLGQGRAEKLISVERRTRRPIEVEGSPGLLAVAPGRLEEDSPDDTGTSHVGTYRVGSEKWTLSIRVGGDVRRDSPDAPARVVDSEASCVVRSDGSVLGISRWLVDAGLGQSLRFGLGPRAVVLHARAGGRSLPALSTGPGAWAVPLDEGGLVDVEVIWLDETAGTGRGRGTISPPRAEASDAPTLLRLATSPSIATAPAAAGFDPMAAWAWRIERAERLAGRIVGSLETVDRSSAEGDSVLAGLLARFALEARLAERAAWSASPSPRDEPDGLQEQVRQRIGRSRQAVSEALELYGLDEFQPYLEGTGDRDGTSRPDPRPRSASPMAEFFGDPSYYRATAGPRDPLAALAWEVRPAATSGRARVEALAALALIVGVMIPRCLGVTAFRSTPFWVVMTAALVGLTWLAPIPGAVLLLAAWVGRH